MVKDKEMDEAREYIQAAVDRAQDVLESFMTEDSDEPKRPKECAPFYLESLGAAYAMALAYAFQEGQPKESILGHLDRMITSAKLSIKANEEMMKSVMKH